jgi:hypothetical protein
MMHRKIVAWKSCFYWRSFFHAWDWLIKLFLRTMRIAVVHHTKAGDYAEYLSALINSQAVQNGFAVKVWSYSIPASQQHIPATPSYTLLWKRRPHLQ